MTLSSSRWRGRHIYLADGAAEEAVSGYEKGPLIPPVDNELQEEMAKGKSYPMGSLGEGSGWISGAEVQNPEACVGIGSAVRTPSRAHFSTHNSYWASSKP